MAMLRGEKKLSREAETAAEAGVVVSGMGVDEWGGGSGSGPGKRREASGGTPRGIVRVQRIVQRMPKAAALPSSMRSAQPGRCCATHSCALPARSRSHAALSRRACAISGAAPGPPSGTVASASMTCSASWCSPRAARARRGAAARPVGDGGGQLGRGRGRGRRMQAGRVAVPPAVLRAVDVPHDIARITVGRFHPGHVEPLGRIGDLGQQLALAAAFVHQPHHLGVQPAQRAAVWPSTRCTVSSPPAPRRTRALP